MSNRVYSRGLSVRFTNRAFTKATIHFISAPHTVGGLRQKRVRRGRLPKVAHRRRDALIGSHFIRGFRVVSGIRFTKRRIRFTKTGLRFTKEETRFTKREIRFTRVPVSWALS